MNNTAETNMRDAVSKALLSAKILIAQGKTEEAKLRLRFVIENGNKLYDVQVANDLFSKI